MEISRSLLVIALTVSLLIWCSGCAASATANIPAGPNVGQVTNTIPAGPSVVTAKHFAKVP
jgi:ABC-type Mn2+/Zn2+ transport system permease subunit